MGKQDKIIGSVHRALSILDLFDRRNPELGTTDIARALNLPKSTVAGLISTLRVDGYLEQNPANRKYRLGYKLAERAGMLLSQFDLRQIATPYLETLRDQCNESVNLAIRDRGEVVYIERLQSTNTLSMRSEIGKHEKIHSTGLGKAILAFLPVENIMEFISQHKFTVVTPNTITNPTDFLSELQRTRQRGYAIDDEENESGGRCVAAPILDFRDNPVAAISISVPKHRLPDSRFDELGAIVKQSAFEISRKMGAQVR